jgi:uncharacterized repeat protein (TIGR03803 family)
LVDLNNRDKLTAFGVYLNLGSSPMNPVHVGNSADDFTACAFRLAAVVVFLAFSTFNADAQTFTLLHSFRGGADGGWPSGTVSLGRDGNLYGTASGGGMNQLGTVWEITP